MSPKASEPTNPEASPESTLSEALSSNERALFDDLFRALDCLVLERSAESDAFRPIHMVPEWAPRLITAVPDQPAQDLWISKSDFLDSYITSVAQPGWELTRDETFDSLQWEEAGLDLDVAATTIGPRKLVMIKSGSPSRRAYIQLMREKKRNIHLKPSES